MLPSAAAPLTREPFERDIATDVTLDTTDPRVLVARPLDRPETSVDRGSDPPEAWDTPLDEAAVERCPDADN